MRGAARHSHAVSFVAYRSRPIGPPSLVGEVIEENVDAQRITIRTELVEKLRIVTLALEGIRHVRVVRHHRHDAMVLVSHSAEVDDL